MSGQIEQVLSGLNEPTSVFVDGNSIYYGQFRGSLYKKSMSNDEPATVIISSQGIYRTDRAGEFIYVTESGLGTISRVDLTNPEFGVKTLVEGLDFPSGIVILGDKIYFCEYYLGQLSYFDLLNPFIGKQIVVSGLDTPTGITNIGDEIFISEIEPGRVSKVNINDENPKAKVVATGLDAPTELIAIGKDLLVSEFNGNRISKLVYKETPSYSEEYTVESLVIDIEAPTGLFFDGHNLYMNSFFDGIIYKMEMGPSSTQEESTSARDPLVFPNPSSEYIEIANLKNETSYRIYDTAGIMRISGIIESNQKIDTATLASGMYSMVLDNKSVMRFIKE